MPLLQHGENSSSINNSTFARQKEVKLSTADFVFGSVIGEGSFSTVIHAKRKGVRLEDSLTEAVSVNNAIKVMEKRYIMKEGKVSNVMMEKKLLSLLNSDLIVKLYGSFQDQYSLYLVMDLCTGGELSQVVQRCNIQRQMEERSGRFEINCAQYYSSQILRALEYIHGFGIIHRDLKPSNVLLTSTGCIKLADFGSATMLHGPSKVNKDELTNKRPHAKSFVGTADYVSPEVLKGISQTTNVDLWSFGCVVYELLVGSPPFRSANECLTVESIMNVKNSNKAISFHVPPFMPDEGEDLVLKLLLHDPISRLGASDLSNRRNKSQYDSIRFHPFFQCIDWNKLENGKIKPPFIPEVPNWFRKYKRGETIMRDDTHGIYEDFTDSGISHIRAAFK